MPPITLLTRYLLSPLTNKLKSDTVSFNVATDIDYSEDPEGWEWKHTDILINGRSLFDRLKEWELGQAKVTKTDRDLAGMYIGIDPTDLKKILEKNDYKEVSLWQCSKCRSGLCSSHLVCKMKKDPLFVYLYDFHQVPFNRHDSVHPEARERTKWDYNYFGPFKFSRKQLAKELASLQ